MKIFLSSVCVVALLFSCATPTVHYSATPQRYFLAKNPEAPAMLRSELAAETADRAGVESSPAPPHQDQSPRMIYHRATLTLRSADPETALDSAEKLCRSLDGYVENRSPGYLVLRIPAPKFRTSLDQFIRLGYLVGKEIRSDDISDQFRDVELRLKIAKTSLQRYVELLASTQNTEEKTRILKEIQRLSEQIERDEAVRATLANQASYGRLELLIQPFAFQSEDDEPIDAFLWIRQLNPSRSKEMRGETHALKLVAPPAMVDLKVHPFWPFSQGHWAAASNDGSEFWAYTRDNIPRGNAAFWAEAIYRRLKPQFSGADTTRVGSWRVLLLRAADPVSYTWMIALTSSGKRLWIAQSYFPDPEATRRHLEPILNILREYQP